MLDKAIATILTNFQIVAHRWIAPAR